VAFAMTIFSKVWRNGMFALLLAAFLVPPPTPTFADEVRALYAAQGLLCASDDDGAPHRQAHCVLCVIPDVGIGPECALADRAVIAFVVTHSPRSYPSSSRDVSLRRARAPPSRFV